MKRPLLILLNLLTGIIFFSCQKEIDVDLNSAEPKTIIEAELSDQPSSGVVTITRSLNFDEPNNFPPVTGAIVTLSDNEGNIEVLAETSPGQYLSSAPGTPGRTYSLEVISDGNRYTSEVGMPLPVEIDTMIVEKSIFGDGKTIDVKFTDPADVENYFRLIILINGEPLSDIQISSDDLQEGQMISHTLFFEEDEFVAGDSVTVFLQSISESTYEYFRMLAQITGGGEPSASPSNPASNISTGVLGYFNPHAVRSGTIVIQ